MCEQCKECEVKLAEEKRMVEGLEGEVKALREKNRELEAVNRNQKEMIENLLNRMQRRDAYYLPDPFPPIRPPIRHSYRIDSDRRVISIPSSIQNFFRKR